MVSEININVWHFKYSPIYFISALFPFSKYIKDLRAQNIYTNTNHVVFSFFQFREMDEIPHKVVSRNLIEFILQRLCRNTCTCMATQIKHYVRKIVCKNVQGNSTPNSPHSKSLAILCLLRIESKWCIKDI